MKSQDDPPVVETAGAPPGAGDQGAVQAPSPRLWARLIITYLLIPLLLFVCAGDLGWWQGWAFSLLIFTAGIAGRWLAERRHPGLLVERERTTFGRGADAEPWDRVLSPLMGVSLSFPLVIVAGLDHRLGWSPVIPAWLTVGGLVLVAIGYALAVWALVENRFFSGMVRIQTDRGHAVVDSGPYRFVRHPGYAGNLLPLPGIVLGLGSLWTLLPALFAVGLTITRTALEDQALQEKLPGYREYAQRVRYLLLPGVF